MGAPVDKRYQVFISSTFTDLEDERRKVYQSILEMDCIPAGMELFPALDEEQFNFIKKIIDDSDYYILIIGGRYGSISTDGVSYTEKEYDYAVSKGIKVIALLHGSPQNIPASKTEKSPEGFEKLEQFRKKVATGRLVREWNTADQLPGLVTTSLNRTMKTYPATGWVRGTAADTTLLLTQINELRVENERLRGGLQGGSLIGGNRVTRDFDKNARVVIKYETAGGTYDRNFTTTLGDAFAAIGPSAIKRCSPSTAKNRLESYVARVMGESEDFLTVNRYDLDTLGITFYSCGLIDFVDHDETIGVDVFWKITPLGLDVLVGLRGEDSLSL